MIDRPAGRPEVMREVMDDGTSFMVHFANAVINDGGYGKESVFQEFWNIYLQ